MVPAMEHRETPHLTILGEAAEPWKRLETSLNCVPGWYHVVRLESRKSARSLRDAEDHGNGVWGKCLVAAKTGPPDFAEIRARHVPDSQVVESKSFKRYRASCRNEGVVHEHVTNRILDDLVDASDPAARDQ